MPNKSQFGRTLINAVDSVDVFKKLKQADNRKMARLKKESDVLDETLDKAKLNRNLANHYMRKVHGVTGQTYHEMTPEEERKARQKRLKK